MRATRRIVRGFQVLRVCGSHLFDMARDFDAESMRCGTPWFVIVLTTYALLTLLALKLLHHQCTAL